MSYVPTAEDTAILSSVDMTADVFSELMWASQDLTWMANVSPWDTMKSSDLVIKINEFLNSPAVSNKTESAPLVAEFMGIDQARVDYIYDFYGAEYFIDLLASMEEIIPVLGHPANEAGLFIGIFILLVVVSAVFLGLRLYSRVIINGALKSYDWVLLAAYVITLGLSSMSAACLNGPEYYRGFWDRSWYDARVDSTSYIATAVLYPVGITLIKASLLIFYWGLTAWGPLRIASCVTGVVVFANLFVMIFTHIFRCKYPIGGGGFDEYWNNECSNEILIKSTVATGALNIVTDVAIWLIPLPLVWKVSQGLKERILASFTFGIGALACIAVGFRFMSIHNSIGDFGLLPKDQTPYLLWTMVEMFLAIICSCVPAIRALIIKKAPSFLGSSAAVYTTEDDKSDERSKITEKSEPKVNVDDYSNRGHSPA